MRRTPEVINISGQYRPALFYKEEPSVTSEEREFWTPERLKLANGILDAFASELAQYGVSKIGTELKPSQFIRLQDPKSFWIGEARMHPSGEISGDFSRTDQSKFAVLLTQELGHFFAARVWEKEKGGDFTFRRVGLGRMGKFEKRRFVDKVLRRKVKKQNRIVFDWIDEAVVDKTGMRILNKYYPELKPNPEPIRKVVIVSDTLPLWGGCYDYSSPRIPLVSLINSMCEAISQKNQRQYPSPEKAYILFEKAVFGRGNSLEWGRAIENTYGRGGLRRLAELSLEFGGNLISKRELKRLGDFLLAPLGLQLSVTKNQITPLGV